MLCVNTVSAYFITHLFSSFQMLSDCTAPFKTISSPLCARAGAGHITLESLLDSPGLTPPSPLSESQNNEFVTENGVAQIKSHINLAQTTQNPTEGNYSGLIPINESQRLVFLRDVCAELLCVLRSQDINGYFLSSLPALGLAKVDVLAILSSSMMFGLGYFVAFLRVNVMMMMIIMIIDELKIFGNPKNTQH